MHIALDVSQAVNIVDQVRNLILNLTLDVEKAGILCEGMSSTSNECKEAPVASQNFFIQNAGVIGNVSDNASVKNHQSASIDLNVAKVSDPLGQVDEAPPALPAEVKMQLEPILKAATQRALSPAPNKGALAETLNSMRKIAKSASRNLTAQGIVQMVRLILGAQLPTSST